MEISYRAVGAATGTGRPPAQPRQLARAYAGVVLAGVAAVAAANWVVNPWGYYPPRYFKARIVDDRGRKCALLARYHPPAEQLVLGSSRMMRFDPGLIEERTGLRTFNLAVPGAAPVDFLTLYRFAAERARAPVQSVIIGVETPAFCGHERNHATIAANPQLREFLPRQPGLGERASQYALLLSSAQTRDSWRSLQHALSGEREKGISWQLGPNGLNVTPRPRETPEQHRRRQEAAIRDQLKWRYLNVEAPDPDAYRDLASALALLRRRGVKTTLVATPTLEPLLDHWRRTGFLRHEEATQRQLRRLADRYGARFVDFSRVERFNGNAAEFEDAFHPGPVNARRMIEALFPPAPAAALPYRTRSVSEGRPTEWHLVRTHGPGGGGGPGWKVAPGYRIERPALARASGSVPGGSTHAVRSVRP